MYALCMLIAIVVPFLLTVIVGTHNGTVAAAEREGLLEEIKEGKVEIPAMESTEFTAFASGRTVDITTVVTRGSATKKA